MNTTPDSKQRTRRQQQHEAADVIFEINLVDGAEAERSHRGRGHSNPPAESAVRDGLHLRHVWNRVSH